MQEFIVRFLGGLIGKIAHNAFALVVALFFIGGTSRVADHYQITPVKNVLSTLDGVLVTESKTVVVTSQPSTTVVIDAPATIVSGTSE